MNIAVLNQSTVVPSTVNMVGAVGRQLHEVATVWDRKLPVCRGYKTTADVPADAYPIVILDDADQADALGYHDIDPQGRPYGRVFAKTILDNGGTLNTGPNSVSACLSHEALELFGDEACSEWGDRGDGSEVAWELCDPVQNDSYTVEYYNHPVAVSDFVLPAYFDPAAPGPYDKLGRLTAPFSVAKGGYLIVRKAGPEGQRFGEFEFADVQPPAWQAGYKWVPGTRTVRRLT